MVQSTEEIASYRVLITGGSGFIGTHLIAALDGAFIVNADLVAPASLNNSQYAPADIRDEAAMDLLFGTHKFNCVIHLAAAHKDFGIPEEEYFSVNEGGMKVLCALCTKYNVQKFVFFSSVAVYGTQENSTDETTLPSPDNHYGASKWSAEKVLHQWQHENAERLAIILRPALVFGEGNTANMYRLIDQISKKRYFNVGRGNNVKSIAYVKNVINATLYLLNAKENGLHIYNYADTPHLPTAEIGNNIAKFCGNPSPMSIPFTLLLVMAKPFDVLIKLTGRDLPISSNRVRKFAMQTWHNAPKIVQEGFVAKYSTIEGLNQMVNWYKQMNKPQ